jgi:hypothetical protein
MTANVSSCKCAERYLRAISAEVRRWYAEAQKTAAGYPRRVFIPAPVWDLPQVFVSECPQLCAEAEALLARPDHREVRVERRCSEG